MELRLQNSSGRFGWLRLVPPHPGPPWGRGNQHPASLLGRASLPLSPCAPRFNAETAARPSAVDSPRSGGRFSPAPRERAGVRGKERSKRQCTCDPRMNSTTQAPCAPRFDAETPARRSPFDSPPSGGRFSLSLRERAGVRGKERSKHQCPWWLTPVVVGG